MNTGSNSSKWLVAYYSLSGNTRSLARELASKLDADCMEIQSDRKYSSSPLGYIKAAWDTGLQRNVGFKIEDPPASLVSYSGVVIASPVWMSSIAPPVQSFLQAYAREIQQVAFLVTMGGNGAERAFKQMENICNRVPVGTLAISSKELIRRESERLTTKLDEFAGALRATQIKKAA